MQRQLRAALEKFAETTRKYALRAKKPIITTEQAEESLEMVNNIRSDLNLSQAIESYRGSAQYTGTTIPTGKKAGSGAILEEFAQGKHQASFLFNGGKAFIVDADIKIQKEEEAQKDILDIKGYESNPLGYLNACKLVIEDNARNFYTEAVLDNIEKMMLAIPIRSPEAEKFWRNLPKAQAKEALNILQSILRIYGRHCYMKGGYALPQRWLTAASIMFTAGQVANAQFTNDPNFSHLAGYIQNAVQNKSFIGDPYSVTRDPRFDKRVEELKEQWQIIKSLNTSKKGLTQYQHYDQELVERHQLEKEFSNVASNADVLAGYDSLDKARVQLYRLANGQLPSEEKRFADVLENLAFCSQFDEFCLECGLFEVGGFDYFTRVDTKVSE